MEFLKMINLALRFFLEVGALVALGCWGYSAGKEGLLRLILGIGAPLLAAFIWGTFVSPKATLPLHGSWLLFTELSIFGLSALALYSIGCRLLAFGFVLLVLLNKGFMFYWSQ